jgi:hypothetical protein
MSLMTEKQVQDWIRRRLGEPVICVPELNEGNLNDALVEAKHWFNAKKGIEKSTVIPINRSQVEYDLPEDCEYVVDCSVSSSRLELDMAFSPYIFFEEPVLYPFDIYSAGSTSGLYSSIAQLNQYNEMAKRVLGTEFSWFPTPEKKIVFVPLQQHARSVIVEYRATVGAIEKLSERDHDFIKRYALALIKIDVGRIRSKYDSMPAAQGRVTLDGRILLEEGFREREKLDEDIISTAMPMWTTTG